MNTWHVASLLWIFIIHKWVHKKTCIKIPGSKKHTNCFETISHQSSSTPNWGSTYLYLRTKPFFQNFLCCHLITQEDLGNTNCNISILVLAWRSLSIVSDNNPVSGPFHFLHYRSSPQSIIKSLNHKRIFGKHKWDNIKWWQFCEMGSTRYLNTPSGQLWQFILVDTQNGKISGHNLYQRIFIVLLKVEIQSATI